ncbi:MAG: energy transducer TonB, partial [Myxococcales bacterium]|nr:energy transducer TonB [Myxococcales bacterium]
EIRKSSGHAILDEAAVESVRRWRFRPGLRGGRPADAWVEVPVRFSLRDA